MCHFLYVLVPLVPVALCSCSFSANSFMCQFLYVSVPLCASSFSASSFIFALITSCSLYRRGDDMIRAVSAYSEIPCSIRVVEDGYGDVRLSWFSSLPSDSFVTTSSAVLELYQRIQRSRVRFASWKTVMVKQDCRGFSHYLRTALLRRHQLASNFFFNSSFYTQCV